MKRLDRPEINACVFLSRFGARGYCPGRDAETDIHGVAIQSVLDSLVRKKRAVVAAFDDGAVYFLTDLGRSEIE